MLQGLLFFNEFAEIKNFRVLCCVRVLSAVVNVHIADELATKTILGEHAFHHTHEQGVHTGFDVLVERLLHELLGSQFFLTAGIAGVVKIDVVSHLFAGENNFVGIDDDYIVTALNVGRVAGLVLTHKDFGNFRAETAEMQTGCINNVPLVLNALSIGREGSVA